MVESLTLVELPGRHPALQPVGCSRTLWRGFHPERGSAGERWGKRFA